MTRIIDLSITLTPRDKSARPPQIEYVDHEKSAERCAVAYGVKPDDFREGKYAAIEHITLTTHDTTHLDAPYHYYPTTNGRPARTIDQIPLEWCFSDGVILDFHHKKKGENISRQEVQGTLLEIGYQLKPLDIVLIRTDACKHFDEKGYEDVNPGMSREATLWLIQQGIKIMGIDAWGWDRALGTMIDDLKAGHKEQFWESHYLGKEMEYCHMERLCNLDKIPVSHGFKVAAFPIKIEEASAGWVRAVAILDG
ncbi:cyclase family protein [Thermodesulfobacteriota bacterium]